MGVCDCLILGHLPSTENQVLGPGFGNVLLYLVVQGKLNTIKSISNEF